MKKISTVTLATVAALSVSTGAFAGGDHGGKYKHGGDHMRGGWGQMGYMHMLMDANSDGSISQKEFNDFRSSNFAGADKNRDGALNLAEFEELKKIVKKKHEEARTKAKMERMKKYFGKIDANGDGKISKEEFDAKGERSFIRMDHNDDGVLSKDDRRRKYKKMRKMMKKDHK